MSPSSRTCGTAPSLAPAPVASAAEPMSGPQLRFVPAGPGELSAVMRAFHEAAERGELDEQLPRLALLELDLDADGPRLEAAGCRSRMIPLFAVPSEDGRCTDRRIEGSIHGPGSPAQILPRLQSILPR